MATKKKKKSEVTVEGKTFLTFTEILAAANVVKREQMATCARFKDEAIQLGLYLKDVCMAFGIEFTNWVYDDRVSGSLQHQKLNITITAPIERQTSREGTMYLRICPTFTPDGKYHSARAGFLGDPQHYDPPTQLFPTREALIEALAVRLTNLAESHVKVDRQSVHKRLILETTPTESEAA
jgi:hypothetical protein